MVEYRCSNEESYEATQVIGMLYDSIAFQFAEIPDAQMVLTWMLYRANLDHRVGTLYLAHNKPFPSRMPGWDRLTRTIVPQIISLSGNPEEAEEFFHTVGIPEYSFHLIVKHIYAKAIELGALPSTFNKSET